MFQKTALIELIREKVFVTKDDTPIIKSDALTEGVYLFDFRNILLSPKDLTLILDGLSEQLSAYQDIQIGGMESAAIPLITGMILRKGVSGFYMRKSRKKTGLLRLFEGTIDTKKPVILVDDIINSGTSIMKQIYALEKEGIKVIAVAAILRFHPEEWYSELKERNIKIHSLISHDEIAQVLGVPPISHTKEGASPLTLLTPRARFSVQNASFHLVAPRPAPYFDGTYLYTGMDDGYFYALEPSTLKAIWKYETGPGSKGKRILSTATGNGKYVFFGSYDGNLTALEASTGKLIWKNEDADWIGSSPCFISETHSICIGMEYAGRVDQGGYTLFDADTGKVLWSMISPKYTHASPVFSKKYQSIFGGSNDGLFYRLDIHTGKILWMVSVGSEIKARPTLSGDEEYIIFGAFNGGLYVLETATGKEIFRFDTKFSLSTIASLDGDRVYFSSPDKHIYALDFKKKVLLWSFATGGRIFASPVVKNDMVYCGSNDGDLYVFDKIDGTLKKKWLGVERIVSPVVFLDEEHFALRTIANELYLF
ncbi:PQQ-binding-like beta-propeller repeat protein [Candidatus Gracilibacteria bacterium]|nr:PQQ-binding-like beta-propeller repeat protein [Candidatus Gracilibacteria bacterium]